MGWPWQGRKWWAAPRCRWDSLQHNEGELACISRSGRGSHTRNPNQVVNWRLPATAPYWLRVLCKEVFRDSHILAQVPEHHLGLELLGGGTSKKILPLWSILWLLPSDRVLFIFLKCIKPNFCLSPKHPKDCPHTKFQNELLSNFIKRKSNVKQILKTYLFSNFSDKI